MPRPPGIGSHAWDLLRMRVFGTHGTVCHLCGHGGARTVDHVIPVTERPDLALSLANLRPAHGSGNRCPTCSVAAGKPVFCNEIKHGMSTDRAKRKIQERTGLRPGEQPSLATAKPPVPADSGREW